MGTRARLHEMLLASEHPLRVDHLAEATGLHHTGVRQHLAVLVAAGLATQETLAPDGRGRPSYVYRGLPRPMTPYERLAFELADALRSHRSPREQGRDLGVRLGAVPAADPVDVLLRETHAWGFAPGVTSESEGAVIELTACPFADLAAADAATVCQLHLGMAEGIADRVGGITVEGLEMTDPRHGGCRLHVRRTG